MTTLEMVDALREDYHRNASGFFPRQGGVR
jgi:hypothetical protein